MARIIDPRAITGAKDGQQKYGIPASVQLAQYVLESQNGTKMPPGSNNPFGMKTRAGTNDPYVVSPTEEKNGGSHTEQGKFRKFSSLTEAFDEHAKLLGTAPVYANARKKLKGPNPASDFADALTGVYATDPKYGSLLKSIMKTEDFYRYDDIHRIKGLTNGAA